MITLAIWSCAIQIATLHLNMQLRHNLHLKAMDSIYFTKDGFKNV